MLCISAESGYAVARCPSVRPSRSWTLSKRINISSKSYAWDLWRVIYLPADIPSTWDNQSSGTGDVRIHFTRHVAPAVQSWTRLTTKFGRNAQGNWTRMCSMSWLGSKRDWWRNKWGRKRLRACIPDKAGHFSERCIVRICSDLSIRLRLPTVTIPQTENNLSTNACDDGAETKSWAINVRTG